MKEKAKGPFVFFQPLAFLILVGLLFGNEADSSCLYFPQVSSGLVGSNAELGVVNTSGRTVTGSFVFYDPSGYLVSKSLKATINPRGSFRFVVDEHCENPEQVGYVVFDTTSENCSGYALISRDNSRACVLAGRSNENERVYLPRILDGEGGQWTFLWLLNTTENRKRPVVVLDNGEYERVELNPFSMKAFFVRDLFGDSLVDVRSGYVGDAEGIVAMELFGDIDSMGGAMLDGSTDTEFYLYHLLDDVFWKTDVFAFNLSPDEITSIEVFNQADAIVHRESIPPNQSVSQLLSDFDNAESYGVLKLESSAPVKLLDTLQDKQGGLFACYDATCRKSKSGWFLNAASADSATGIALANCSDANGSATLIAYAENGRVLDRTRLDFEAMGKVVDVAGNLFEKDIETATHFSFHSEQDLVGFRLNISKDKTMLDALPATENALPSENSTTDLVVSGLDWRAQDYPDSRGVTIANIYNGALILHCQLDGSSAEQASGEALLDLKYQQPFKSDVPVDMTDKTISVELYVPDDFVAPSSCPNGIQAFVKDENFCSNYGTWHNATKRGKFVFTFQPSGQEEGGRTAPSFRPDKIREVGLKVGVNAQSSHRFEGRIRVTKVEIQDALPSRPLPRLPEKKLVPYVGGDEEIVQEEDGFFWSGGKRLFLVGGSVRGIEYGQNFGTTLWFPLGNGISTHRNFIDQALRSYRQAGCTLIRVGLVDDGRTLLDIDGTVVGYDTVFRRDVATLLDLAYENEIMVEFCLVDFLIAGKQEQIDGVNIRGRREIFEDSAKKRGFFTDFFLPFLAEFGSAPALFGFDLINEPEWIVSNVEGGGFESVSDDSKGATPVALDDLASFLQTAVESIRDRAPDKFATVGISLVFLNLYEKLNLLDLDYLGVHYYPWMGSLSQLISEIPEDKPWILSEFPATSDLTETLNVARDNGGCGALLWNLSPGIDSQCYSFVEEEAKLREIYSFVEDITDFSDVKIELLEPDNRSILHPGNIVFKWRVEGLGNDFTSELLIDKGPGVFDGWINSSHMVAGGVCEYEKFFRDGWWQSFNWSIRANGINASTSRYVRISEKASDLSDIRIELISPADDAVLPSGKVTFKWRVQNAGDNFVSRILIDKGSNPYDDWIETHYDIDGGVTEFTKSFSSSWYRCFCWGLSVSLDGKEFFEADESRSLCIQ